MNMNNDWPGVRDPRADYRDLTVSTELQHL